METMLLPVARLNQSVPQNLLDRLLIKGPDLSYVRDLLAHLVIKNSLLKASHNNISIIDLICI